MKTRKLFSRIMAAVFAMILVLGMSMTALADSNVTINNTKASGNVTAYKLFDRTEQDLEGGKKAVAYTLSSKYEGFFTQEGKEGYGKTGDALSEAAYNYVAGLDANTLSQFAADMWKWISENNVTVDNSVEAGAGTTTMNLPAGYYLIFPAGAATLTGAAKSPAILQDVDGTNPVDVTLKSEYPTLDKKVTAPDGTPAPAGTVKPGDTVTYTITSKVPDVSGYTKGYKFVIKDTLSDGLTFNKDTVSVKIGENALDTAHYTLKAGTDATPNTFTLELKDMTKEDGGKQVPNTDIYPTGKTITLTYTATVNEKAVTGIDPNTNKAMVEYSNKPGTEEIGKSEEVEAKVYTFEFGIYKYSLKDDTANDEEINRNALANAQFKLYADKAHNTEIKLVEETGKVYRQAKDATETAVDYIETDATGKVTIKGLKEGTYYLAETKAPAGFNKLVGDIKVEIGNLVYDTTDTTKLNSYDVTYTMPGKTSGTTVKVEESVPKAEIPVLNKAGSILPSTGGMGTVVFTIAGAAIIGLMLVSSLVSKKRKRSE